MIKIQAARTGLCTLFRALGQKAVKGLSFLRRHKIVATALALVIVFGATAILVLRPRQGMPGTGEAGNEGYIRTVTLERGTLEESISATGTVESAQVSTVTTDLKYTVKEVYVKVGDSVQEGDVICTLDTTELEESIQKLQENLAETRADAQEQYEEAQASLTEAQEYCTETYDDMEEAEDAMEAAESAYNSAAATVSTYQSQVDAANSALLTALNAYNQALASNNYDESNESVETAKEAYDDAQEKLQEAQSQLQSAQSASNYTALSSAYNQAQTAYQQAQTAYENSLTAAEAAEDTRDKALETYNEAGDSDELEELQSQLEKCTLKAQTSGKVTALNATVGSAVDGAAATIQDTDQLVISISIAEYDIENVEEGMQAIITSDVIEGEISGTLSQISPTASGGGSSSSTFSAQVTVNSADSGLLIGTNASVEIIQSTTDNVFTVPLDAIETQEDGTTVIYVRSEDQEDTFEPVTVTVGQTNDYYAEISGDALEEGMVVKASVLDESNTETTQDETGAQDFSGSMPGGMENSMGGGPEMNGNMGGGRGMGG